MASIQDRLREWLGEVVVVDCVSPYVAVGELKVVEDGYLELADADMHDLRDSTTSRENYLVKTALHGVQSNRSTLVFRMDQVVGVSRLSDLKVG
jgi:hypothetical protein